jgi:hypothetical protein
MRIIFIVILTITTTVFSESIYTGGNIRYCQDSCIGYESMDFYAGIEEEILFSEIGISGDFDYHKENFVLIPKGSSLCATVGVNIDYFMIGYTVEYDIFNESKKNIFSVRFDTRMAKMEEYK